MKTEFNCEVVKKYPALMWGIFQHGGSTVWRYCLGGHLLIFFFPVTSLTNNLCIFFLESTVESRYLLQPCAFCLHFVPLWCTTLKSIRDTHFSLRLSLSLSHLTLVSWDFMHSDVQHTPTPCARHRVTLARWQGRSGWNAHLHIYTSAPPVLCHAVNAVIVFWPHFLLGGDKSLFHLHARNTIQLYL